MNMGSQIFCEVTLPKLQCFYPTCTVDLKKSSNDTISIRLNLQGPDDSEDFKNIFSNITCTEWIVYRSKPIFQKFTFRKTWICQHSKKNKQCGTKRNADCAAKLKILIKKLNNNTKKNDEFLRQTPPLMTEVIVSLTHSHDTSSSDALRMLRVSEEVKEMFFDYFSNGMTVIEASTFHENKFLLDEKIKNLANSSMNPTHAQIRYLHKCWRQMNLENSINPLEKLREKIEFYESEGAIVKFSEGKVWAVVIVTSVMQRTQCLDSARDVIFVDSTCSCEATTCNLTIFLTATKAGALPIAAIIHASQTKDSYKKAFKLLKKHFPYCFGGETHPAIFMTSDSAVEKAALRSVWADSIQLLCHFHVAQAEWRWLCSQSANIPPEERSRLMKLFQAVMYANSENNLEEAVKTVLLQTNFPDFVFRFLTFYERKNEWVLLHRINHITGENNYAEATLRVLKEILLCRTKTFNVFALSEFCIFVWEKYLIKKLLEFAHSKGQEVQTMYFQLCHSTQTKTSDDVLCLGQNLFQVKSTDKSMHYIVNTEIGACTCPNGNYGSFCKHQFFLMQEKKINFPSAPPLTPKEMHSLAYLAQGIKCPSISFSSSFNETFNSNKITEMATDEAAAPSTHFGANANVGSSLALAEEKEELAKELCRISNLLLSEDVTSETARKGINICNKIRSADDFTKLYFISSRSTKVPSGRPPLGRGLKRKRKKLTIETNSTTFSKVARYQL